MKKIALTSLLTVFAVSAASAATTPYVAAHVGWDSLQGKIYQQSYSYNGEFLRSQGYDLSLAGGVKYDLNSAFAVRGELEFDFANGAVFKFHDGDDDASRFRSYTALANAYLDIKTVSALTPYVGAGIGYQWSYLKEDAPSSFKPHSLAWQVGAGVSYALNSNLSLDLGYRYLQSIDKIKDMAPTHEFATEYHQFRLGAAYAF